MCVVSDERRLVDLCWDGDLEAVAVEMEELMDRVSSLELACDRDGRRPLHLVAVDGSLQLCQAFISAGACINTTDNYGSTPLSLGKDVHLSPHTHSLSVTSQIRC